MTIYFDHAATSWPKPDSVGAAMARFLREDAGNPGRGAHALARRASAQVGRTRRALAELIGAPSPTRLVFGSGATDALNLAIHGLVTERGARVLITPMEHNAVLRPLAWLARTRNVVVEELAADELGFVEPETLAAALSAGPAALVCINHVSNVNGVRQDLSGLGAAARAAGVPMLVDGAQSVGHMPLSVVDEDLDLLAIPGHKGLHGPPGVGALWVAAGVELEPRRQGGTGHSSEAEDAPIEWPTSFEAGTINGVGLAGLEAALRTLPEPDSSETRRLDELAEALARGLASLTPLTVHAALLNQPGAGPVISVTSADYEPQDLAALLDAEFGVAARAGLHCAPRAHRHLGTGERGSLRFSLGLENTLAEVEAVIEALQELHGLNRV